MNRPVAATLCCVFLVQGSVVAAEDLMTTAPSRVAAQVANGVAHDGPLRRASLGAATQSIPRDQTGWRVRAAQDSGASKRSWMERHPVVTGALIGFGTGVGITYAIAGNDDDEFLRVISTGAAALFWGGVSAGVGALAGWGFGRNRDDNGS